jgi:hypothetical protein
MGQTLPEIAIALYSEPSTLEGIESLGNFVHVGIVSEYACLSSNCEWDGHDLSIGFFNGHLIVVDC